MPINVDAIQPVARDDEPSRVRTETELVGIGDIRQPPHDLAGLAVEIDQIVRAGIADDQETFVGRRHQMMRPLTDRHACDFPVGLRVDQADVVVVGVEYDRYFGGDRSRAD